MTNVMQNEENSPGELGSWPIEEECHRGELGAGQRMWCLVVFVLQHEAG